MRRRLIYLILLTLFLSGTLLVAAAPAPAAEQQLFLPLLDTPPGPPARIVNAPYHQVSDIDSRYAELAVFWFGQISADGNAADVRVGYNDSELYVAVAVFDRRLHYPPDSSADLTQWDSVELLLDTGGASGQAPRNSSYRLLASLHNGGEQPDRQRTARGDGDTWQPHDFEVRSIAGWRGEGLNDNGDDRGWALTYRIPFAELGGRPADGSIWGIGLRVFDRDGASLGPTRIWPETLDANTPSSWGGLHFGLPQHRVPAAGATQEVSIRHRLNGADVPDGAVGGGSTCGAGLDFWREWGERSYYRLDDDPGVEPGDFNIQNQSDIADWPCFSRYYISFPLDAVPAGAQIVAAQLVLHQIGNAQPDAAQPSFIQVLTVAEDWEEASLTWNNSPPAQQNIGGAWVGVLREFPGFPGVARTFDVSYAAAQAQTAGTPLRLALYSADNAYHSGKYFVSGDTGDWNADARPALLITYAP
ncbi:MAG: DNRLRE domain-containing protein [Oscillochloris sp.]|nr:DNRLRE domain-containing protein [Oscillochloris sp.]